MAIVNTNISDANKASVSDLNLKQNKLLVGDNITIASDNTISAVDTKYTAGTGISISSSNVISAQGGGSTITVSSDYPSGGKSGDMWYRIV